MKKKIATFLSLLLTITSVLGTGITASAAEPVLNFTVSSVSGKPGEKVDVTVTISGNTGTGISSLGIALTYDRDKLDLGNPVDNQRSANLPLDLYSKSATSTQVFSLGDDTSLFVLNNVTILTLPFKILEDTSGGKVDLVMFSPPSIGGAYDNINGIVYETSFTPGAISIIKPLPKVLPLTIAAPAVGNVPESTITGEGCTGTVTWQGNPSVFASNTAYTATFSLVPDETYEPFDAPSTVTINDATVTPSTNTAGSITFDYTFPATGNKKDVSNTITFHDAAYVYDGTKKSLPEAATSDTTSGKFSYVDGSGNSIDLSQKLAGTYSVKAVYDSEVSHGEKTAVLTINKAPLAIVGAVATDRAYDKTTAVNITGYGLSGVVSGDAVTISEISGTVTSADVGEDKPVTVTFTLSGADKDNYSLAAPTGLTVTISASEPTYDVPTDKNIKVGSALATFTSVAPSKGAGIGGEDVPGTVSWHVDGAYSTAVTESDVSGLAIGNIKSLYWKFTPVSANYATKQGETRFTIVDGDPQPLFFASEGPINKTYGDATFVNELTGAIGAVSYKSSSISVATVSSTGQVTIVGAGEAVITATAAAIAGQYAETEASYTVVAAKKTPALSDLSATIPTGRTYTGLPQGIAAPSTTATGFGAISVKYDGLGDVPANAKTYAVTAEIAEGTNYTSAKLELGNYTIAKAKLTPSGATVAPKTYDGTTAADVTEVSFSGLQNSETLTIDDDYIVTDAAFDAADVLLATAVSGNVTLVGTASSNYELASAEFSQTAFIGKATLESVPTATVYVNANVSRTFNLSELLVLQSGWSYKVDNSLASSLVVDISTSQALTVVLANDNYEEAEATINAIVTDKELVTEILPPLALDKTYDGVEVTYSGDWTAEFTPAHPVNAGDYTLYLTRDEDEGHIYEPVTIAFTISKAELSVVADSKTIAKGIALPEYTITTSPSSLYATDSWTTSPAASSPTANAAIAGVYPILLTPGVLSAPDNYSVTYENGTLTVEKGIDASLASLSLGAGIALSPAFESGTASYTTSVPNSVSSVTVSATPNDSSASVSGTGSKELAVGENIFTITVTAEDGTTTKDYTVTVTRANPPAKSADATLASLSLGAGVELSPSFESGTASYTASVPNGVSSVTVSATPSDSSASVAGTGSKNLAVGENIITITVTAEDGTTTKDYTVTVTRANPPENSADATLASLSLGAGVELSPLFESGIASYTASVPNGVSSVIVSATPSDPSASVAGTGSKNLAVGENIITITVTAEDGTTTKSYTVTVTRANQESSGGGNEGGGGGIYVPYIPYTPAPTPASAQPQLPKLELITKPYDAPGAKLSVKPSSNLLILNGIKTTFPAFLIHDYNFLKLRDLAMLLSGTKKQFSIGWDSSKNIVTISSGKSYASVGDELKSLASGNQAVVSTTQKFIVDGKTIELVGYNYNGYNFVRLRDIAILLDFSLAYSANDITVNIDLNNPYKE
ncbi:MAG: cadherin-like beta sandwich domain-containing protein [Clostridiales bacterium]|jgi:hypothetical protein|nr:cadherin-like beta sandwich domain-containing protein [Clostridiales bacterium]